MNKTLFAIMVGLVVLLLVVTTTSSAQVPTKSPLPPGSPWATVWKLFSDLQEQIDALKVQVATIPAGPPGPKGPPGPAGPSGPAGENGASVSFGPRQSSTYNDPPDGMLHTATAMTDGIVTCLCTDPTREIMVSGMIRHPNGWWTIVSQTGKPRTAVDDNYWSEASITMPVLKGETWRIGVENCGVAQVYWHPLVIG